MIPALVTQPSSGQRHTDALADLQALQPGSVPRPAALIVSRRHAWKSYVAKLLAPRGLEPIPTTGILAARRHLETTRFALSVVDARVWHIVGVFFCRLAESDSSLPVVVIGNERDTARLTEYGAIRGVRFVPDSAPMESVDELFNRLVVIERCNTQALRCQTDRSSSAQSGKPLLPAWLRLSPRELEVLKHLARGDRLIEIATALCVSYKTVDTVRTLVMDKLGIHDRVKLALYAVREGLISLE